MTNRMDSLVPRDDFPALERYNYLNSASISLMPLSAKTKMQEYEHRILHAGTVSLDEEAEVMALEGAREGAARLLGVSCESIAVTNSATEPLCVLAWALQPKGNIVSIDMEFPSVVYPWSRVAKETGAEVRLVDARRRPAELSFSDLERLVDEQTSVVCVSHVQYATGHCFDLRRLADLAHAHGALCIVDASQSAGCVPIDAEGSDIDAMVATAYKWMCGPFGAAFFYLHPRLFERIEPVLVGWRGTANMWSFDASRLTYAPSMRRFEYSTLSYASAYGLGEALRYLLETTTEEVYRHDLRLCDQLIAGLDDLGAEVISPRSADCRGSIVSARFPGRDGEAVAAELNGRGVVVSPRFGSTRFSPHLFNTSDDIDAALNEIAAVLSG